MAASADEGTETAALREYYSNSDYVSSPEGIMKLLAVLGCLSSGVLFLVGGGCAGSAGLAAAGATVAFATAGLLALQLTATLLAAPLYAPHAWLYTDVVGSAVLGVLLVLGGILSVTLCDLRGSIAYVHAVSRAEEASSWLRNTLTDNPGYLFTWFTQLGVPPDRYPGTAQPLAAGNAALVVGASVATYAAVTRRWDAARGPAWEPRRPPPVDVDA